MGSGNFLVLYLSLSLLVVSVVRYCFSNEKDLNRFKCYCAWPREEGQLKTQEGLPGGAVVKNLPANAGDTGSSPGPGRSHMPRSS